MDWQSVLHLARIAKFSYTVHKLIDKGERDSIRPLEDLEWEPIIQDDSPGRAVVLTDAKKKITYISFKGTTVLKEVWRDLQFTQRDDPTLGIDLHRGFATMSRRIYPEVKAAATKATEAGHSIVFAGHSLGGAMASITALWLVHDGFAVERVVTFGCPKVTDTAGVKLATDRFPLLRVMHENDLVAYSPGVGDYDHFGESLILAGDPDEPDHIRYGHLTTKEGFANEDATDFWDNLDFDDAKLSRHKMSFYIGVITVLENAKEKATSREVHHEDL